MHGTLPPLAAEEQVTASPPPPNVGLFQDIPQWIWTIFLSAWAIFFGLMILFFATTSAAAFVVTIAALFGLMAFGLPMALAAQSQCGKHDCAGMIDTHTGPLCAAAVGTQIALIPVAVVVGLIGFIVLAM
ncbi:MAG TPA: hypothetical protein VFZ91_03085 [Allosphingosinicella sp.]